MFIKQFNHGSCIGGNIWLETEDSGIIESFNPSNGKLIASVYKCSENDYDKVIKASSEAFKEWQMIPAPKRGELIRLMANALRENKDLLGSLVSLEMGKIKAEGDGEVQEMIDIADFAVGLSRQLYGLTMHSERPMHRMYEQWHPVGNVGIISASPSIFWDSSAVFCTSTFGAPEQPLVRATLTGSGHSNFFKIFSNDTNAPYTINGLYVNYRPSGRQ